MLLLSEEVFSSRPHNTAARMRACGANILAPGLPSPLPSPPVMPGDWRNWEVVSSYSSATASGFHGIPRIHTRRYKSRKELERIWVGTGGDVKVRKLTGGGTGNIYQVQIQRIVSCKMTHIWRPFRPLCLDDCATGLKPCALRDRAFSPEDAID
jgi:hypothetical protein